MLIAAVTFGTYTYPPGYDGQKSPCPQSCAQCDRTEAVWRCDPANTVSFQQIDDATSTAQTQGVGIKGGQLSATVDVLALMQAIKPRAAG